MQYTILKNVNKLHDSIFNMTVLYGNFAYIIFKIALLLPLGYDIMKQYF